jgi:redox-sensing transcriptional repressor
MAPAREFMPRVISTATKLRKVIENILTIWPESIYKPGKTCHNLNCYYINDFTDTTNEMLRATILRLQAYLDYITAIRASGRTTVTSEELATVVGLSSSRIRQDLIQIRVVGRPRSGYDTTELEVLLSAELDVLSAKGMALIGCGNLGMALAQSGIWDHAGFALRAIFDNSPDRVGQEVSGLTVRHIRELHGVVKSEKIVSACLAVPATAAHAIAGMLVSSGITGIWNFAPVSLRVPLNVIVENQHLERGLMTLSCLMKPSPKQASNNKPESNEYDTDDN